MAKQLYTNNAAGTLNTSITSIDTSITLGTGEGLAFPSPTAGDWFIATLFDNVSVVEIVKCTSRSGDVLTVVRGQEGTSAADFASGSTCTENVTEGTLEAFVQRSGDTAAFATGTTAVTQSSGDASTKLATTAYVDTTTKSPLAAISAAVATSQLTLTINPQTIDFHSSTIGSGAVSTRYVTSAINTVLTNGSSGGTGSGIKSQLAVLAIDNVGTVEVAWCNAQGSVLLDEGSVINTTAEGGAGGATSASVIYSTTARTGVAFRIMGYVEFTETVAGTWATAPNLIQGSGGNGGLNALTSYGLSVATASTSGTSITYTGLPAWVKRVNVMFAGTSLSGTSSPIVQLGFNSSYDATNYIGSASRLDTGVSTETTMSTGFLINGILAANTYHGKMVIEKMNGTTGLWVCTYTIIASNSLAIHTGAGTHTMTTAGMNCIKLLAVNGTDTFDAGSVNISYE